uniref:Archaeal TraG-like conjugative protein n=1 Tax=Saccharolobus solfataricus (strain ATCC 35092 / DSM 1617 / JCM 11322 / P2) TaxID=273057 RepID=S6DG77_SACS2|nr:type IV secretion system DNA-binding domain-containing protein [Saccharolobus solfataricus]CDF66431.1 archaeal TraG-like conjugative protein [Saccharolobus solfataricus P2]
MWGKKEQIRYYELFPKIEYDKNFNVLNSLGHVLEIIYSKDKDIMRLFAYTNAQLEILRKDFGVKEGIQTPIPKFVGRILFKNEKDFYWGAEFNDFSSFLTKLQQGEQLRLWVVLEPRLNDIFLKYSDKLKRNQSPIGKRQREVLASRLESYAKDNIYYLQPYLLSSDKDRVKQLAKELQQFILTKSRKLKLEIRKTKGWEDEVPRIPRFHGLKLKRWLWIDEEKVSKVAVIPNPSVIPVQFSVGGLLPDVVPNRKGFRIGVLTFSGKEVQLELEDFYRHAYVIGGTGAGKTSTLRILLKRIREAYPKTIEVILDPHGDFAEEMLSFYANYHNNFDPEKQLFYFHPIEAPISVNPVALPRLPNAQQALLLGFANVMEIFEKLFALKEGAVYVKYIIQNALQLLYQKNPEPTFHDLYNIIIGLRNGTLDLPINSKDWEEKLELFQDLDDTTFVSALSRIEMLATNPLLLKIFSKNSIDDNTLFAPGNVIIINASKGAVGDQVSFLLMAGWVFKIWYFALARAQLNLERIPVIIAVDEFQNIADLSLIDTVLAEARKYGMHLVLAHQHTGQIDMNLLKSLMSNTGVKFLMKMQGSDAEKFAEIFPEFKSELVKILPSQSVGQATIIITPRKPDDKIIPIRTNIDYEDFKKDTNSISTIIERMKKYEAQDISEADVTSMLNPILKYVEEKPDVLAKLVLYETFNNSCENGNHCIALVDLVRKLGIDRDRIDDVVAKLDSEGYLSVEKIKGKKVLQYGKGLFPLKGIVENEAGKTVALKVISRLYKEGLVVVAGKQQGDIRPDFVAFPYDKSTMRPDYNSAIAVEIESDNEISTHGEQVKRNMQKYIPVSDLFKEIRVYTSEESYDKLKKIYDDFLNDNSIPQDYKSKVKIFSVKIKKEMGQKPKNKAEETGEFNGKREESEEPESKESKQETVPALAQGAAANNANSKLGSSTQSKNTTIEQQPGDKEALVEVEIEGKNYFVKRADYEKLQQILSTKNYKIEGNKIYAKIGPVRMEVLLISNRPSDSQGPRNP